MKIEINGTFTRLVEDDSLLQDPKKNYTAEFVFDPSWAGFSKQALFEAGGDIAAVSLTGDRCTIPDLSLKKAGVPLRVALIGTKGETSRATGWCVTGLILHKVQLELPQGSIQNPGQNPGQTPGGGSTPPACGCNDKVMAIIGDPAGFEGKTLVELIAELQKRSAETATDGEVDEVLDGIFGQDPEDPQDNTATDQEVDDILNDVFG